MLPLTDKFGVAEVVIPPVFGQIWLSVSTQGPRGLHVAALTSASELLHRVAVRIRS